MAEIRHNTTEQVEAYLTEAAEIVARLELPAELRVPAFEKACDLVASKTIMQAAPGLLAAQGLLT